MTSTALTIAFCSLLISFGSFVFSIFHWKRSFRPIVSAMVKTHSGGNQIIAYDLVVLNSGTLPAKNIQITAEAESLNAALGQDASDENKTKWLAAFDREIYLLHNGDKVSCSFGTTQANDTGFWKYDATILITVTYEHWFRTGWRRQYEENQRIRITDSDPT